ncbi:MAG: glycosyltransferase family 2 protein [Gammaproteobacteria bacterium]
MCDLTLIVLTYNEEKHIERCLCSARGVADQIFVVDSGSEDCTVDIAKGIGAVVVQRAFTNQADQFQWALDNYAKHCGRTTEWIMRLDADEYATPELVSEISRRLSDTPKEIVGFTVGRCVRFKGKPIYHGGHYQRPLRVWRHGRARMEERWMDEHVVLSEGNPEHLKGEIIDDNLNGITWWTDKHNRYASREAVVLLDKKYKFMEKASGGNGRLAPQAKVNRWMKDRLYSRLPLGWRALGFYFYRMIFRLGFLDGRAGLVYHFLQGFWYRLLVDVKVWEVERRMMREGIDCIAAIREELGIEVGNGARGQDG